MRALILDGALEGGTYLDTMGAVLREMLEALGSDVRRLTLRDILSDPASAVAAAGRKPPATASSKTRPAM